MYPLSVYCSMLFFAQWQSEAEKNLSTSLISATKTTFKLAVKTKWNRIGCMARVMPTFLYVPQNVNVIIKQSKLNVPMESINAASTWLVGSRTKEKTTRKWRDHLVKTEAQGNSEMAYLNLPSLRILQQQPINFVLHAKGISYFLNIPRS